jgi:hypothetical protein
MDTYEQHPRKKGRAILVRCDDQAFLELLNYIRTRSDIYLVYSKSSNLKLIIREEVY